MSRNLRRAGLAEFIMDIIPVAALTAQPLAALPPYGCAVTAATDATGVSVFIDSLYESQAQRRARLSAPLQLQCSAKKRLVFSLHFRYNRKKSSHTL